MSIIDKIRHHFEEKAQERNTRCDELGVQLSRANSEAHRMTHSDDFIDLSAVDTWTAKYGHLKAACPTH